MSKIPELLVSLAGEKIDTVEKWEKFRKKEILALFSEYMYGFRDIERPQELYFKIKEETVFKGMLKKDVICGFGDFSFPFSLYLPKEIKKPVPTFVCILTETPEETIKFDDTGNMVRKDDPKVIKDGKSEIPVKSITERGFGIVLMPTRNVYRDWQAQADFKQGVFSAFKPTKKRQKNSWASISAWAWGASRVCDYLETDADVDDENIAVIGHSRGGKAALWAGATDERFKLTVSNNSGCAGAAIQRGKVGERIKDINISDWFCENYHSYNDCEEMLPVDQHMLLALMAPRYIYVTSSELDTWADPNAEYLACKLASPAFELYGTKGLVDIYDIPRLEVPLQDGHIAYHMKWGDHSIGGYDWNNVMAYFEKIADKRLKR